MRNHPVFLLLCLGLGTILFSFPSGVMAQGPFPIDTSVLNGMSFRELGPKRGGRVTAVSGVAQSPGSFYMGATGGGVWKTTDYGQSWNNVSDGYFPTPSIGSIAVSPSDPQRVYVGTGSDGLRSNVIAGKGVFGSRDGGKTWQDLGLPRAGQIGAVIVDPEDPDRLFVAAIGQPFGPNPERGVFRSTNGGKSWEKVFYHSDTVGVADLEFAPDDSQVVYAALWRGVRKPWTIISGGMEGGIYKSTDGGDSWNKLAGGLPTGLIGKIDLAVSAAEPNRVYALIEAPEEAGGLYHSSDYGESWELVSTEKRLLDRPFYYCNVDANPRNADAVYVSATQFWFSANGGKKWKRMRTPHGDNHDLWIHPADTLLWIQSNDGGANVTRDGGKTWSTQNNQPTAELYQVAVDDQFPYWLYAGQQDNTTIALPNLPPYASPIGPEGFWMAVGGCETGPAIPKPGDPNIVYANCKGRFGVFDKRTGQEKSYQVGGQYIYGHNPADLLLRFQRVAPIHVSPHDPDVVYHGSQFLHKTTTDGLSWETISPDLSAFEPDKQVISGSPITRDITGEEFYSTIYSIRESPLEEGLIWVGANDGPVHVTRDGGETWVNVTPEDLPPGGRVDAVEPSPHRPGKAYIAVLRYQLDDWKPYIYRTDDYGENWTLLSPMDNGLPDGYPARVVREDPEREGLLYAGTEYGLFISADDGATWQPFQLNLPITPVTDIALHRGDLVLSTMGRGFWIMDNLSPLRQEDMAWTSKQAHLLPPADQYRHSYRGNGANAIPKYPDPGVTIDYYLGEDLKDQLILDILDAGNNLVRRFTSAEVERDTSQEEAEPDMATGFLPLTKEGELKSEKGFHRFTWNLRRPGPWDKEAEDSGEGGPRVSPGQYYVRLSTPDGQQLQPLQILLDPRLEATGLTVADLEAQEAFLIEVVELESAAKRLEAAVANARKADGALSEEKANALQVLEEALNTEDGRYPQPMLLDQISYLRGSLRGNDQRPGADAYARYAQLKGEFNSLASRWKTLMGDETSLGPLD